MKKSLQFLVVLLAGFMITFSGCGGSSEKGAAEETPELSEEAKNTRDNYMKKMKEGQFGNQQAK